VRFAKYHALGNDYLVVEEALAGRSLEPGLVRRLCDRHRGVGSDGILEHLGADASDARRLRIWNPDGSQAEKSGNGLRIFARYLWDRREVGEAPFAVSTTGGRVICVVREQGRSVTVEMGRVSFDSAEIPVRGPHREVLREPVLIGGQALEFSAATIGNPHCVILREIVSADEARSLGPLIESDERFPNRTNVQFLEVLDRHNLKIEIWERGAGYTLASGSSSCAAAAVARRLGLCEPAVTVHMAGGSLAIEVDDRFAVRMTGPVVRIAAGEVFAECLIE
jgi:diaminopimelate epimerase